MEAIKIWWHDGVCGKITSYNYHAYAKCKHRHAFYWSCIWILYCQGFKTVGCIHVSDTFIPWANFLEQDLNPFKIVIRAELRMTMLELCSNMFLGCWMCVCGLYKYRHAHTLWTICFWERDLICFSEWDSIVFIFLRERFKLI